MMKEVCNFYNNYNYPLVNQYTNRQRKKHLKLISEILSYVNLKLEDLKDKDVLDAGCGTCDKSILLAKNSCAKITALDFSDGQLDFAKANANKANVKINFVKADLINSNLEKLNLGKFDLIICTGVLHHTENPKKGFCNLIKLLKPKGKIVIALYHKYSRLKYRLLRFYIHTFISKDAKAIEEWLMTSKNPLAKKLRKDAKNALMDRYAVPFESYHTLREVRKWFKENNIKEINHSKNASGIEQLKIFEKKTLFFVGGIKQ
ncbi:MAG: class I SAM-dependent methyltransferase [archaeon]